MTPDNPHPLRSRFIVLDGPEGSGKSTQLKFLVETLQKHHLQPLAVRDPGTTQIGEKIRAILLDPAHAEMTMRCEMLLYMAARAQMIAQIILPALAAGQTVICDRFVSSTLAYQVGGDGLTEQQIRSIADIAIQSRWPDLTIILDIPITQSFARVQRTKDRIEQRPPEYHEQVRRNYLLQAAADPAHYRVIDAARTPDAVHADIWAVLTQMPAG